MPINARNLRREHVEAYIEGVLARCRPATASVRYRALARFFAYLVEEGEVRESPMARMKPPLVPEEPVPAWATRSCGSCWRRVGDGGSRSGGLARARSPSIHD